MWEQLADHLETLAHNVLHPEDEWICRRIVNHQLKPESARRILARNLTAQLETQFDTFRDGLTDPLHTASPRDAAARYLSVGFYMTQRSTAGRERDPQTSHPTRVLPRKRTAQRKSHHCGEEPR
jgi:hypothetical protein